MGNIILLDELTINKIAAGEVIERPASVVKEMVENSIDAGAKNITIEIRNGGISYIRIVDDGKGIQSDDLEIAFERHATSKIRSADDLTTVKSMGFRGEALASIAAVANVEMTSRPEEQQMGYKIVVEGGEVLEKEEVGCPKGTIITVQNLFFNTPVRYKFLKKDYTESGYIEDVVTRIALVHPEIAIKFINTGKTLIQTNGNGDFKSVVYSIYGKDVAEGIIEEEYTYEDIKIKGVVGKPEICRSNRTNQIFFVNKRYIRDKNLSAAVTEAYKGLIPIGKFGFVILDLEMNPTKVDVNVHPAKLEVRFEEENKVFKAVYHAIKDALSRGELVENIEKEKQTLTSSENIPLSIPESKKDTKEKMFGGFLNWKKPEKIQEKDSNDNIIAQIYDKKQEDLTEKIKAPKREILEQEKSGNPVDTFEILEQLKKLKNDITQEMEQKEEKKLEEQVEEQPKEVKEENIQYPVKEEPKVEDVEEVKEEDVTYNANVELAQDFNEMYLKTFGTEPIIEKKPEQKEENIDAFDVISKDNKISMFENIEKQKRAKYKFLGIAFNTYIIFEIENELYLLDQHAAHERILYEKVKKNYYTEEEKNSQMLLLPDIITLTHKEMDIAKDNMQMFKKAGFILEEFGENTIKISGVPDMCVNLDTKELFLETLDEINTVARTAKQEIEERFLATVACKAAVKANMILSREEVDSLINQLLVLPNPFTCPHGRPTAIKMTKYDLERKFARK